MRFAIRAAAACTLAAVAVGALAQGSAPEVPQNILQLSASGEVEVAQDLLVMALATTREGPDAASVQTQLRQALDAALPEARRSAQPGQMEVRTGTFSIQPRYGKEGQIGGWQGRAELILEGRDFARISTAAGRIQSLAVSGVRFDLSREARERVESEAQSRAVEAFKARAAELARGFGFAGYSLREVTVNSHDSGPAPRPAMMAMAARVASAEMDPVPVEAGKTRVVVNISGSVQLR